MDRGSHPDEIAQVELLQDVAENETRLNPPLRVNFWEYDRHGEMKLYYGNAISEFTDPEDYRPSYSVKIDTYFADYPNQHMTPYVSECRVLDEGEF